MTHDPPDSPPIIFFDGVCGLCNSMVDLLLRIDRQEVFKFAALQGETAQTLLPPRSGDPGSWSVVLVDEHGISDQSDAALAICRRLGSLWAMLSWLRFIPRFLRDPIYRFIARNRYRIFGKRDTCRIPTEAERARFLP